MKKKIYIKTALALFLATTLFSSCLKDKAREFHFEDSVPTVDFPGVAFGSALTTATLSAASTTNSLNALITVGATHDYTTPTAVTVTVLAQADINTAYGAGTYTLLPATVYTTSTLTTNINPGIQVRIENEEPIVGTPLPLPSASLGLVSFVINTAQFQALDQTKTYVLPLKITGASGNGAVIDQYNTVYYKIAIK